MNRLGFTLFLLFPLLSGCGGKTYPPIVFDDWWNFDFMSNSCDTWQKVGQPCFDSGKELVVAFENEVETAFSTESNCHGLVLVHGNAYKSPSETPQGEHFQLILDLNGHRDQEKVYEVWGLVNLKRKINLQAEITTPQRLVQQVCEVVKGIGGNS